MRRFFNAIAAISLVLVTATVALWVRSYFRMDSVYGFHRAHMFSLDSRAGTLTAVLVQSKQDPFRNGPGCSIGLVHGFAFLDYTDHSPLPFWQRLGFGIGKIPLLLEAGDSQSFGLIRTVSVPYWCPCIAFGVPIAIWVYKRRIRRVRRARGLCIACSYDLTGNTSGVCPECGMPVATQEAQPRT